jgi:hypothetical protein
VFQLGFSSFLLQAVSDTFFDVLIMSACFETLLRFSFHNAPSLTSSVVLICFLLSLEPHMVLCCREQVAESSNVLILPVKPQMDMLHRTLHPDSAMMMSSRGFHVDISGVNAQYILS